MTKNQPVVQIKNVSKKIGKHIIIDNLSFDIHQGEVFGFLGPNGAGKTTTIRMMLGLMSITSGEIYINGHSIQKDFEKAILKVGGIVENPEMYKYLTGYQNLIHYARMYKGIGKDRIDYVVKWVGLEQRIHDKVKTYSLGMRQRLGLAQALLHSPRLLVLDEPTNGVDPAGIKELRNHLRMIAEKENIAVLVSSHLLSEMELMCDRIGIIQNGKLVEIQKVKEFLSDKSSTVKFIVDKVVKAKEVIENIVGDNNISINGNSIDVLIEKENIPKISKALVLHDIDVFGIETGTKTLEDKFLEVTGGNEIV